ncbi:hypothetical protein G6F57_021454 [Rhizopus arrhizus]|nr:hypothetical protein G6F57_021454 [Rhizopus arrhizus]
MASGKPTIQSAWPAHAYVISAMVEPGITMLNAKACAVVCGKRKTDVMIGTANTAPPTPKKPPNVPHRIPSAMARRGVKVGAGPLSARGRRVAGRAARQVCQT